MNEPLFDSSRNALVFALNASKVDMPRPFMNKAMAQTPAGKKGEKGKDQEESRSRPSSSKQGPTLRGLEAAAQAGFILLQFSRLDEHHQVVLTGLLTRPRDPCSCGNLCCSGWRPVKRYAKAVRDASRLLADMGEATQEKGKRGLSPQPRLHQALIEQFFAADRRMTLIELARLSGASLTTVAKHRDWIWTCLEQVEDEAWLALDPIFDQAGITGFLG